MGATLFKNDLLTPSRRGLGHIIAKHELDCLHKKPILSKRQRIGRVGNKIGNPPALTVLLKLLLRVRLKLLLLASRRGVRFPPFQPTNVLGFTSSSVAASDSAAPVLAAASLSIRASTSASYWLLPSSSSSSSELRKEGLSTMGSDLGISLALSKALPASETLAAAAAKMEAPPPLVFCRVGMGMGRGRAAEVAAAAEAVAEGGGR